MWKRPSRSVKQTVTALIRFSSCRYFSRSSRMRSAGTRSSRWRLASRFISSSLSYGISRKSRSGFRSMAGLASSTMFTAGVTMRSINRFILRSNHATFRPDNVIASSCNATFILETVLNQAGRWEPGRSTSCDRIRSRGKTLTITHRSACLILILVTACTLALAGSRISAQGDSSSTDRLVRAIDTTLASVYGPDQPGATAIVVRDGRVLLRKGYGLANVELNVAMRPDMVMALASLSKSFTAAGILELAEQGKLSLQDDIRRFLPAYPARGATITIEHLLTHTSGVCGLAETSDLRAAAVQDAKVIDV